MLTLHEHPAAEERLAVQRERNLARGRETQAQERARARARETRARVDELRRRRAVLERRLPDLESRYARALRHVRCDGLDEAGDQLRGTVLAIARIDAELRRAGS